jgi:hypothetical protein
MLDYNVLKGIIVQSMYGTFYWPLSTTLLDMLITGNTKDALSVLIELAGGTSVTEESKQVLLGVMGIHCADRTVRVSKFDDFLPVVDQLYKTSKLIGDVTSAISMICAQWKMSAKEVYTGDFQAKTKKPVQFIGNTGDGFTPLASVYNVSSGFKDSVVLEVNGYGVCTRSSLRRSPILGQKSSAYCHGISSTALLQYLPLVFSTLFLLIG